MTTAESLERVDRPDDVVAQRKELVARARALRPLLEANADRAEEERSLPDENYAALLEAELLSLCVPRRYGGLEAPIRTYTDVTIEVSRYCGSSGWYCFILNMADWILGSMHPDVQDAVWSQGPDSKSVSVLNPMPGWTARWVDGGVVVSGQWGYASGSKHAKWAELAFPVLDDAGKIVDFALGVISMQHATVLDTWYVAGMSGTGSNTLEVKEAFIPETWLMRMSGPPTYNYLSPYADEYMYRTDPATIYHTVVVPPVLGLAQAALDHTVERLTAKPKPIAYTMYTDATKAASVQLNVAQAAAMIDAALLQMRTTADELDAQSYTAQHFAPLERAKHLVRAAHSVELCRRAVDLLLDAQGAGAFARANPMQRIWRDLNTAARHGLVTPGPKQEIFGRAVLGVDEQQMSFFR